MSADSRLRAVLLVLALLDDEDEQAAAEALDDADHTAVFWSLVALVRSVGVEGFGSEDELRWFLRQLAGACETTAEFGPPDQPSNDKETP
jgi:hypothetical protein